MQRSIARALPADAQVVTGQTVINEEQTTVSQALSSLNTVLLIFALISLFVGAFTIFNTFSIIVGQRTRELALLRVVGASRGQVLSEAAIVGFVSSAVGVGLGVAAAVGLKALLGSFGTSPPSGSLTFEPRTAIVGLAVGALVTVVSAIGPARNTVRIPPVAALTDRAADGSGGSLTRRRLISGAVLAVFGAALLGLGLSRPVVALVGAGAVCVFVGVAVLPGDRPAAVGPARAAAGRPVRHARLAGTGELHAEPGSHRADRFRAHGRARAGVRDGGIRRVVLGVGHERRGPGDQRRPADLGQRERAAQRLRAGGGCRRAWGHREFLVLAALLGLVAASWPARRAAWLDVLAAIAAE